MELRHLRYFVAVAEAANFTRAAVQLGIGQPPLSQQIKSLELEIGVSLFRRTSRGVVLTEAGEAFRIEAVRVLDDAERATAAARRAGRGQTGQLRLGFTGSAAYSPVVSEQIRRFRDRYGSVELTLQEANTSTLLHALERDQLDAAFIRPGPGVLEGMQLLRLPDEPMMVVVPASHALAKRRRVPVAALAEEPFVLFPRSVGLTLYDEVMRVCREAGFEPVLGQPAPQIASIINLVAAGLGVSIVPAAISQVRLVGVRYLGILGSAPKARLAIATRDDSTSITVSNFLRLVAQSPA
jgi:DNA-binding transcriptional LysR family regulator